MAMEGENVFESVKMLWEVGDYFFSRGSSGWICN